MAGYRNAAYQETLKNLTSEKNLLLDITKIPTEEPKDPEDGSDGSQAAMAEDLVRAQELLLEQAQKMPRTTVKEIAARNVAIETIQKQIDAYNELGTKKQGVGDEKKESEAEKKEKARLKKLADMATGEHEAKMALIKQNHLEGKTSEDQYNAEILIQEIAFQQAKMAIYKQGSKEHETAYSESLQLQVDAQEKVKELLLKAEKELADAKVNNLEDGIAKQKAIEENRWADELASLQKQLNDKKDLSEQEIALNETLNKTIEEKKKAHLKTMDELNAATTMKTLMDAALIRQAKAHTDDEDFAAQRDLAQAQYRQDMIDAKRQAVKIAQAERKLSDELIRIKKEELDKKQEIGDAVFSAANSLFGGLADLAGKETALGKALFLFQQAAAIGQVIFNTAIANAKAVAQFPLTLGMPWVAINTASAIGSIAAIVAQSIANFSQPKGYASGGYTNGDRVYRAGEAGEEWIAPNWMTKNPLTAPIIANLENWRQNPVTITQGAVKASKKTAQPNSLPQTPSERGGFKIAMNEGVGNSIDNQTVNRLADAIDRLIKWNPSIAIETYERKRKSWEKTTTGGLK